MSDYRNLLIGIPAMLLLGLGSAPAGAAAFVYVSNNEDGDIGMYTLRPDGALRPGARVPAAGKVRLSK